MISIRNISNNAPLLCECLFSRGYMSSNIVYLNVEKVGVRMGALTLQLLVFIFGRHYCWIHCPNLKFCVNFD